MTVNSFLSCLISTLDSVCVWLTGWVIWTKSVLYSLWVSIPSQLHRLQLANRVVLSSTLCKVKWLLHLVTVSNSMSWLPVVLKFLKFHRCPEISNCPEILLIWSECPEIDLCYAVVTALPFLYTFFTSHDYDYVGDIEYQVMFSLVTF